MIQIKFLKWDKYNKRQKDIKNPFWFAMSNDIFLDPFYAELSDKERQTFLWLLCQASKQNKYGEVEISERLFSQMTGYKTSVLNVTIDKLLKSEVAAGSREDGGRITASTRQDKTEQDNTLLVSEEVGEEADEGGKFNPTDLVEMWNELASPSLARIIKLTDKRRRQAQAALAAYPEPEFWQDVIGTVNRSPFLLGEGRATGDRSKPWRCDFDFIIRTDNAVKIIEGKYS